MTKFYIIAVLSFVSSLFNFSTACEPTTVDIAFTVTTTLKGVTTVTNNEFVLGQSWSIEYGTVGFASGSGILIEDISSQSYSLTMNQFSKWDVRIKKQFTNDWSQTITINSCTDNTASAGISNHFNNWSADSCWKGYVFPGSQTFLNTINIVTNDIIYYGASGSSLSFTSNTSNPSLGTMMVLPKINDLGTDKKLKFMVKNYSGGLQVGTLTVPNDPTTFHLLAAVPAQSDIVPWDEKNIYFTNYNGTDQYLAIRYIKGSSGMPSVYLDNISYEQSVECFTPINLSTTNVNEQTQQASFTAPGTQYEIQLNNILTGLTQTIITTQNPYTFTGLVGNNPYKFRVRGNCDVGMNSLWSGYHTFATTCEGASAGYTSSFEEYIVLEPCWETITAGYAEVGLTGSFGVSPETGSQMVHLGNDYFSADNKAYLISRYMNDLDQMKRIRFSLISAGAGSQSANVSSLIVGTMSDPANESTFHPLQTITPAEMSEYKNAQPLPAWKEHTIYFDNYNSSLNDHYVVLKHVNQNQNSFLIDNFKYEQRPSCPEPLYPVAANLTYNSALIGWQNAPATTSTEWQIEYGISGFVPGTGTVVTTTSGPFLLQNLPQDDTVYDFYVRAKCGSAYGNASQKGMFRTKCIGVSVGYTHNFDNDTDINTCWTRLTPILPDFFYAPSSFIALDATTGHSGTKSVRLINHVSGPDQNASIKTIFVSPRLLDFDNFKKVSFWLKSLPSQYSNPNEIIIGTLSDPNDYTTFTPFYTITDAGTDEGQWRQYIIDFSGYSGTDQYVGIRQAPVNSNQIIHLDDFMYFGSACPTPTALTASQSGATSALLTWDNNNDVQPPALWEIEYGPENFTPGSGTVLQVTSNPYTLTGLTNLSRYEFRVRNICSAGNNSDWSVKKNFKVSCAVAAPFYENFDQYDPTMSGSEAGIPGFCWTNLNYYVTELVAGCIGGVTSCPNAVSLNSALSSGNQYGTEGFIVSPYLSDLDVTKKLKFWVFGDFSYEASNLIVGTMSNPLDLNTFVPFQTLTLTEIPQNGQQFVISFANYTGNAKHIAFRHDGSFEYSYIYIDDVYYGNIESCEEPLNVLTQDVTGTSAMIRWEAANGASGYSVEYGQQGFTPGTGTTVTTNATQKQISGLLPETTYQYYIKTVCAAENSIVVGPRTFTTTCLPINLPWTENFNTMTQYGAGQLPDCFSSDGNVLSSQVPISSTNYDYNNLMTGVGDTHFLRINGGFSASLFTPVFTLTAGTTYAFSMMARKSYEYEYFGISGYVGRGNSVMAMDSSLAGVGTIHEWQYNPFVFYFTPMISGDYGYFFSLYDSGGIDAILDQFQLAEGYTDLIEENATEFTFEGGNDSRIILESTLLNSVGMESDGTNSYLKMSGASGGTWNTDLTNPWEANQDFVSKVNMKVDAASMDNVFLSFDLKQTFEDESTDSAFRVVVNGVVQGEILTANSQVGDEFATFEYDLTAFSGTALRISLQHLGRADGETGDAAYLDNIRFSPTALAADAFNLSGLKVYPNPVINRVTIENPLPVTSIRITSITGQVLFTNTYSDTHVELDLSTYGSGVYFIRVECDGTSKTSKIIKK
ncbi:MAG TPA: choice-of-anchor J domain-containing protein [Flavobacterium sp.]|jgi:hypothetical protein